MSSSTADLPEHNGFVGANGITYLYGKAFTKSLQGANLMGGQPQKKHHKVRVVLGCLEDSSNPFESIPVTNHGESRIPNCIKYDLGDGWRLITQQTNKTCTFLFVGDHEDAQKYLENHKGESVGVRGNRLVRIPGIGQAPRDKRPWLADHHDQALVDLLSDDEIDVLLTGLPARGVRDFSELHGGSDVARVDALIMGLPASADAGLIRNVFALLMTGDVDGAKVHIGRKNGSIASLDDIDQGEMVDVEDGEDVRRIRVGSPDYVEWLKTFQREAPWQDWFLFLHPQQERVVEADYAGVAQLSGVSGSGKTCVVVRRAVRLAKDPSAHVLLLTLNRSLAGLLSQLVDSACIDPGLRSRIRVTSFFDLARDLLLSFEPENVRHYEDVTWKLGEHVDEVFREFYRQWVNNRDASVLLPLQKSLNARGVCGETYVREELDWIRSALVSGKRDSYVDMQRKGRQFNITGDRRRDLLVALEAWGRKMRAVGIIDYLGLTDALARHVDGLRADYTNVLVDEAQDFGTTELQVVRALVPEGKNDIFLCGDIAQTVLPKHRSLPAAGIRKVTRERIQQNYRNSREILTAAYDLLKNNVHEDMFDSDDLEILDPRFANFGGPMPMALSADTLEDEIAFARTYAETRLGGDARTVCIAFAGFSSRDVRRFAERCGTRALDGAYDPGTVPLVFSDLEQTKGYEFDCLVIVNCREHVLPAYDAPEEEAFRSACKLYVAMTRAKNELILSFHGAASPWITAVSTTVYSDAWASFEVARDDLRAGEPEVLLQTEVKFAGEPYDKLTGAQFLYTPAAVGMSIETQDRLIEVVDGKGLTAAGGGRRLKWATMGALADDLRANKRQDVLVGGKLSEVRAALQV